MRTTSTTTDVEARDRRIRQWRIQIFAITWLTYAGFYFTRQAFSVAKVGMLEDPASALTEQLMGNLDAIYLVAYAAGQFIWGSAADRFGPRVVVLGGLAMSAVAAMFMGVFTAFALLVPLMVVQGLAQSTGWSSLCKNMSSFFAVRERGRVLGMWSTNYAAGGLLAGPFCGWWAYSVFGTWRAAFFAGAAVVLVVIVLFLVFQRNTPARAGLGDVDIEHYASRGDDEPPEQEEKPAQPDAPPMSVLQAFVAVAKNRMVLTLGGAYLLLKPARYAILLWGPVIVAKRLPEVSKLEAVVIPVAFGVAGVIAPIVIGWISDRVFDGRRIPACVLSLLGLVLVLAAFVPLTASQSVLVMVAMLALIGLTVYAADSMISCVAAVDFGTTRHAGAATGFVNGCGSVGAVLGGLLPGYLDSTTLFYGFSVAALCAALLLLPRWRHRPNT